MNNVSYSLQEAFSIFLICNMTNHSKNTKALLLKVLNCTVNLTLFATADDNMGALMTQPLSNR